VTTAKVHEDWAADFFGEVNQMPAEAVTGLDGILGAMGTEPGFKAARRALLRDLRLKAGKTVFEAGCGSGAALPDLIDLMGREARITATDPTTGFVELATKRALEAEAKNARYAVGDIRDIQQTDGSFDAAFCDKVLIHAGPASAALSELVRVTKSGGRVGALEWMPYFVLGSTRPDLVARFNGMLRQAVYDYNVSANLARLLHESGLVDVEERATLASTTGLDGHPFWRAFLIHQLPMFIHAGLLADEEARAFADDLEALSARGEFSGSFIIHTAAGTKP